MPSRGSRETSSGRSSTSSSGTSRTTSSRAPADARGTATSPSSSRQSTPEVGEAGAALARHWRGAGELEHAAEHFVAAAEEAERGWAKQYAVTLYKEALDMTPTDDVERVRFLRRRLASRSRRSSTWATCRLLGLGGEREPRPAGSPPASRRRRSRATRRACACPSLRRVLAHHLLVRRLVDAVRVHEPLVVDDDVAVLPDDLGNSSRSARANGGRREASDPRRPRSCGRSGSAAWRRVYRPASARRRARSFAA